MVGSNTVSQFYTPNNTQYNRLTSGFNGSLANNGFNLSALNGSSTGINNFSGFNATLMNIQKEIPMPGSPASSSVSSGASSNAASNIATDVSATLSPQEMLFVYFHQMNNFAPPSGSTNSQPQIQSNNTVSQPGSTNSQPQIQTGSATNTSANGQTDMLIAEFTSNGNKFFFEEIDTNSNALSTDSLKATMNKFMETALSLLGLSSGTSNSSSSNSTATSSTGSTSGATSTATSSTGPIDWIKNIKNLSTGSSAGTSSTSSTNNTYQPQTTANTAGPVNYTPPSTTNNGYVSTTA
ncbi:MAG: hypothetical protein HQK89_15945 [Nitrospirae bacterium]|nr:hypothetical protein [Nitrospirota bacterium]